MHPPIPAIIVREVRVAHAGIEVKVSSLEKYFSKKLVLITGGSSGIGLALANQFVLLGANVFIIARRMENLTTAILEMKNKKIDSAQQIGLISTDISLDNKVMKIIPSFIEKVGIPDLLINSAGIVYPGAVTDIDLSIFRKIMDINFFGTVNMVKTVAPYMIKRGFGHIINISSFAGFFASYGYSAYASSKYAVRGFSDVIRAELKPKGIYVSVVFPADTDTPQLAYERTLQSPLMREINASAGQMSAEKVANLIIQGIHRKKYVITPGFEASLAYAITVAAGYLQFPIMDMTIRSANKKVDSKKKV
jgi:3-dehydrosphinganine reductase